ncbi:helix-turn-helix domain-containing protein [Microlunatus elymi]|uniref:Helix-turn-helix domain-containing protein n=1 Tax=Microlunatus elymi TaxID=2596828 RepID=A0A516Q0C2_9ACTN|nr:helix-turn-helix domain-containing protein [Microlunatus elymi]QDP96874.1 helix-turn-helix domain-containing protein [Microlunatus elymi]
MRVLQTLRDASGDLGVQELADRIGLHVNTVRFHLDRLVAEGLIVRRVEERTEPGRPRLTYRVVDHPAQETDGQRSYRLLAEILAGYVSGTPDPRTAAIEAGRSWGHYLTQGPAPYRQTGEATAMRELMRVLDDIGFRPELAHSGDQRQIRLRHCPFLEVATEHREVVCSVHLGLMQGALDELRAPLTTLQLEPFVEPSLCLASLAAAAQSNAPTPG